MLNLEKETLLLHKKHQGKITINSKMPLNNKKDLSLAYTPGVAIPCKKIEKNKSDVYKYTSKGNLVAIVSDGSAVLGLGNIGPEASLPVMEGKAILFKTFANIDAFPICLNTQNVDEIVQTIKFLEPVFGGINLEDISAPRCFEIEERLKKELNIPVFHDDQHGTAVVTLAALINAAKIVKKDIKKLKIVISGAGAAGIAISQLLFKFGVKDMVLVDSKGIIDKKRKDLTLTKKNILKITNKNNITGSLADAMKGTDVFIGVSSAGIVTEKMVQSMNKDAIIFAMANPIPEIMPDKALKEGAAVIGTGRSDFPNQINNVIAFPGLFRGVLDAKAKEFSDDIKIIAAKTIAAYVKNPTKRRFIPSPLDKKIASAIAQAIIKFLRK